MSGWLRIASYGATYVQRTTREVCGGCPKVASLFQRQRQTLPGQSGSEQALYVQQMDEISLVAAGPRERVDGQSVRWNSPPTTGISEWGPEPKVRGF